MLNSRIHCETHDPQQASLGLAWPIIIALLATPLTANRTNHAAPIVAQKFQSWQTLAIMSRGQSHAGPSATASCDVTRLTTTSCSESSTTGASSKTRSSYKPSPFEVPAGETPLGTASREPADGLGIDSQHDSHELAARVFFCLRGSGFLAAVTGLTQPRWLQLWSARQ